MPFANDPFDKLAIQLVTLARKGIATLTFDGQDHTTATLVLFVEGWKAEFKAEPLLRGGRQLRISRDGVWIHSEGTAERVEPLYKDLEHIYEMKNYISNYKNAPAGASPERLASLFEG